MAQVEEQETILGQQEKEFEKMSESLGNADEAVEYYKAKYTELQSICQGCQEQIKEFDNINSISNSLIERLQGENHSFKVEIEILNKKIDRQQKQYFEVLQLKNTEAIKAQVENEVRKEMQKQRTQSSFHDTEYSNHCGSKEVLGSVHSVRNSEYSYKSQTLQKKQRPQIYLPEDPVRESDVIGNNYNHTFEYRVPAERERVLSQTNLPN